MRKTKVKRPEKETATTATEEGQDSSLREAPSATKQDKDGEDELRRLMARSCRRSEQEFIQTRMVLVDGRIVFSFRFSDISLKTKT